MAFSLHIAYLGRIAGLIEVQKLTFLQMATAAVLGIVYTLLFEREALPLADLRAGFLPVAYLGLFSSAMASLPRPSPRSTPRGPGGHHPWLREVCSQHFLGADGL